MFHEFRRILTSKLQIISPCLHLPVGLLFVARKHLQFCDFGMYFLIFKHYFAAANFMVPFTFIVCKFSEKFHCKLSAFLSTIIHPGLGSSLVFSMICASNIEIKVITGYFCMLKRS